MLAVLTVFTGRARAVLIVCTGHGKGLAGDGARTKRNGGEHPQVKTPAKNLSTRQRHKHGHNQSNDKESENTGLPSQVVA